MLEVEAQILVPAWQVPSWAVITQLALLAVKLLLLVIENPPAPPRPPPAPLNHAQIQNLITRDRREGLERATLGAWRWLSQLLCGPVPELCPCQRQLSSCLHSRMSHLCPLAAQGAQGQGYVL